ncbi:hypothetical protein BIW11_13994, partial [Tropilaelaps mercedesae]
MKSYLIALSSDSNAIQKGPFANFVKASTDDHVRIEYVIYGASLTQASESDTASALYQRLLGSSNAPTPRHTHRSVGSSGRKLFVDDEDVRRRRPALDAEEMLLLQQLEAISVPGVAAEVASEVVSDVASEVASDIADETRKPTPSSIEFVADNRALATRSDSEKRNQYRALVVSSAKKAAVVDIMGLNGATAQRRKSPNLNNSSSVRISATSSIRDSEPTPNFEEASLSRKAASSEPLEAVTSERGGGKDVVAPTDEHTKADVRNEPVTLRKSDVGNSTRANAQSAPAARTQTRRQSELAAKQLRQRHRQQNRILQRKGELRRRRISSLPNVGTDRGRQL